MSDTVIKIYTYSATDAGGAASRTLVAETRLALDGDTETTVATKAAKDELLALHQALVKEAVAARLAYLALKAK
jgi:hypothetical protein